MSATEYRDDNLQKYRDEDRPAGTSPASPPTIASSSLKRRASDASLDLSPIAKRARLIPANTSDTPDESSTSDTAETCVTAAMSSDAQKQDAERTCLGDPPAKIISTPTIPAQENTGTCLKTLLVEVPTSEGQIAAKPGIEAAETSAIDRKDPENISEVNESQDRTPSDPLFLDPGHKPQTETISTTDDRRAKKPLLLPLELHELILDCFWDDTEVSCGPVGYHVIRNCIKVCSRWYAAARPRFFREVILKSPKRLNGLISLIRDDPNIARWIRKVRLQGVTAPLYPFGKRQPDDAEKDGDSWLYSFPLCFGVPLPKLKKLELNDFAHVSRRREDCQAFARWIPGLATLTSVEILSVYQCEMSSNSFAAFMRAFLRLKSVWFCLVDFTRPNVGVLAANIAPSGESDPDIAPTIESEGAGSSLKGRSRPVEYPLFHPPPSLQSIIAKNTHDTLFDFSILRDCLCPKTLAQSLRVLVLGYQVCMESVARLISDLGVSPKLEHIQLHVGWYRNFFVECNVDISGLTNLQDLVLLSDHTSSTEISFNCRQLLSQVATTHLKSVTLIVYYDLDYIKKQLVGIDADLSQEKFSKLEAVHVKLINTAWSTDRLQKKKRLARMITPKIKNLLPLTNGRGILDVSPWWGIRLMPSKYKFFERCNLQLDRRELAKEPDLH
ncbi:hypothetical protein QCA50_001312 [Cerrena zonata]|uniref:F-box domain-containing protein n=1 Tax=Cerrena zonata TaxID=2478898 RepID=A0AAW0H0Y0_9APHY